MAEPLLRSASLTGYADLARALGLDPHRLTAEQDLPARCLENPDLRIPASAVGRLLERSANLSGALDFGLRLAETRRLSNLGAVAFVLREQPTLGRALDAMVSYTWAQNEALSLSLDVGVDLAILRVFAATNPLVERQSIELTLAVLVRTIRRLAGQTWRPRDVCFAHAPSDDIMTHRRVLGLTPLFDQDFDGIVIDARDLDTPIAGADPEAARRAQRYVELEAGLGRSDPVATARQLILALLPTGTCTVKRVAAHMGVSRRTLHRQLAAAGGPTFTALLDETRIGLAERYVAGGQLSLSEIAERLGYGSLSAFSRWRRETRRRSCS